MKSTALASVIVSGALALAVETLRAQGTVVFGNAGVVISTNSVHGGPATGLTWPSSVASNAYYYALLVAPTNQLAVDSSLAGWTFTGNYGTNWLAGTLSGNYTSDPSVVIPGYPPGSKANFTLIGWSSNVGHDWGLISPLIQNRSVGALGFFAISQIGVALNIAGGAVPPVPVLGLGPGQIPGFTLDAPIPEPSGFWLAALGAGILWQARRRSACVAVRPVRRRPAKP